jgi:putative ABC transport system ATP-binding protein
VAQPTPQPKPTGEEVVVVDQVGGISLTAATGTLTAIVGPTGAGKFSLLRYIAGLDTPNSGTVSLGGEEISNLNQSALAQVRRRVGIIFEQYPLLESLSVEENLRLPAAIAKQVVDKDWFEQLLLHLELRDLLNLRPAMLTPYEQFRVCLGRALVRQPIVIVADAPTDNLEPAQAEAGMKLLRGCVDNWQQTVIFLTRDPQAAAWADQVIAVKDGGTKA